MQALDVSPISFQSGWPCFSLQMPIFFFVNNLPNQNFPAFGFSVPATCEFCMFHKPWCQYMPCPRKYMPCTVAIMEACCNVVLGTVLERSTIFSATFAKQQLIAVVQPVLSPFLTQSHLQSHSVTLYYGALLVIDSHILWNSFPGSRISWLQRLISLGRGDVSVQLRYW